MGKPKGGGRRPGWRMSAEQKARLSRMGKSQMPPIHKKIQLRKIVLNAMVRDHRMNREEAAAELARYIESLQNQ